MKVKRVNRIGYCTSFLMLIALNLCAHSQPVWKEDFKDPADGFDHKWTSPSLISGSGTPLFESSGEIGRLRLDSSPTAVMRTQLSEGFSWDTSSNRYAQMMIPNLEFGERIKLFVLSSADGWSPHILHDEWFEIPGQNQRPQTFDLNSVLPPGQQKIVFQFELIDEVWGEPPAGAECNIDWIKAGMPSSASPAPGSCGYVGPPDGQETSNPPTLHWSAPKDGTASTYTVILSKDPLFSYATTTVLDDVNGTSYTPSSALSAGTWYWSVSATNEGGMSGEFLEKEPLPGDPRNPANHQFYSFVVSGTPTGEIQFPDFNTRAGSQGFSSYYRFTEEPLLVEQARVALEVGSNVYKFLLGWDHYQTTMYPDLPVLPTDQKDTIVELIRNEPAYQTVLDMPFKFFPMWTYGMGIPYWHFGEGLFPAYEQAEYNQIYELTRYLMQTYEGTGKVFILSHWEGDWVLLEGQDYWGNPRESMIQGMKDWYRMRQQAVEDARGSLPHIEGVEVYHAAEVNIIQKAIDNPEQKVVANSVLPDVTVDLVSYSSYDATNHTSQLPQRLHTHLDYIQSQANFSGVWPYGKPVFIGEYGWGGPNSPERGLKNLSSLKAAGSWGCPLILFWSIYSVNTDTLQAWINAAGIETYEYFQNRLFVGKAHILKNATRVWLKRNPAESEMNQFANNFDTILNSEILQQVIDSPEYRAVVSNRLFLEKQFAHILGSEDINGALFTALLSQLDENSLSRFEAILDILDSAEFSAVISDATFDQYLYEKILGEYNPGPPLSGSRSERYQEALNREEFLEREFDLRFLNQATEEIQLKYRIDLTETFAVSSWEVY